MPTGQLWVVDPLGVTMMLHAAGGESTPEGSQALRRGLSRDGRVVGWAAALAVLAGCGWVGLLSGCAARSPSPLPPEADAWLAASRPALSADGRWVAFQAPSLQRVGLEDSIPTHVFVRDETTGTTVRADQCPGNPSPGVWTFSPSISQDGQVVAFASAARWPPGPDGSMLSRLWVRDFRRNTLIQVRDPLGAQAEACCPSLSADGQRLAYELRLDGGRRSAVRVRDLATGRTCLGSADPRGRPLEGRYWGASLSGDGRCLVFLGNLSGDVTQGDDVLVKDLQTGALRRIGADPEAGYRSRPYEPPAISADGRWLAHIEMAARIPHMREAGWSILVQDLRTGELRTAAHQSWSAAPSSDPSGVVNPADLAGLPVFSDLSLSSEGRYLAFTHRRAEAVQGKRVYRDQVRVVDLRTGAGQLASAAATGEPGNDFSDRPALSGDGRYVAFISRASNLVPGVSPDGENLYVKDLRQGTLRWVARYSDSDDRGVPAAGRG